MKSVKNPDNTVRVKSIVLNLAHVVFSKNATAHIDLLKINEYERYIYNS